MKKKSYLIVLVAILLLVVGGILCHTFLAPQAEILTPEEAEKLCYTVMGEKDEATGFPFSFGATGTYEQDGKQYHVIRASWLVDNSHLSYIGDFFVSFDGKEVYTGIVQGEEYSMGELIWSK